MTAGLSLAGATFLDIGFGQGLTLLAAAAAGANVHGLDINPKCREVLLQNARRLAQDHITDRIAIGSVLDADSLATVNAWAPDGFDIVHSWGVLHHTGAMWKAIEHACALVRRGGHLVLAIYNRHWSSPVWSGIKRLCARCPPAMQRAIAGAFVPIIYVAKLIATRRNPLQKERGMDFYYDVVDWIGGYPYEYASRSEIEEFVTARGFEAKRFVPAIVPTGCNEFIFARS